MGSYELELECPSDSNSSVLSVATTRGNWHAALKI